MPCLFLKLLKVYEVAGTQSLPIQASISFNFTVLSSLLTFFGEELVFSNLCSYRY